MLTWNNLESTIVSTLVVLISSEEKLIILKRTTIEKVPNRSEKMFAFQENGKGKPSRITEQSWWHDANSRHLGFILSSGGRLPKIYFFRDFRVKVEKTKEQG